jgi:sulfate transport system substrate-binding protein
MRTPASTLRAHWVKAANLHEGQHFFRPRDARVAAEFKRQFANTKLLTVNDLFGDWRQAQKTHFDDGGVFDQIVAAIR